MDQISTLFFIMGALVFGVSVITQVLKGAFGLKKVPTDLLVFVISLILTVIALFVYLAVYNIAFVWYYLIAAVIGSFFVAFVAMYGWAKFKELWLRSKTPNDATTNK